MMLQTLIAYAAREGLGDADFYDADVRWQIPLDATGRLTGPPIPLSDDPSAKKPRPRKLRRPFTSPNELTQGDKSHFLCDTLERAALFLDPKTPEKADGRRTQHGYFKSLLTEAATACAVEAARLRAVCAFLDDADALARLHAALVEAKAKPTDNATFAIDGRDLLSSEPIREFWRARRRRAAANAGARETRM